MYAGINHNFLNADLVHLATVRSQFEAFKAAIEKVRERAVLRATQDKLDDFLAGLTDLYGDDISPTITAAEFELGEHLSEPLSIKAAE